MLSTNPPQPWFTARISSHRSRRAREQAEIVAPMAGLPVDVCLALLLDGWVYLEYPEPFAKRTWERFNAFHTEAADNEHRSAA